MRIRILYSLVIFALLLTACATPTPTPTAQPTAVAAVEKPTAPPQPAETPVQKVQVTWLRYSAYGDWSPMIANPGENRWAETVEADFEKEHPTINIYQYPLPTTGVAYTYALTESREKGKPIDIWIADRPMTELVRNDMVADLTPFIQRDQWDMTDFYPQALEYYTYGGKLYGIPYRNETWFLLYNKDVFDNAGVPYPTTDWDDTTWTWDAFVDMCAKLTQKSDKPGESIYGCVIGNDDGAFGFAWMWGKSLFPDSFYQTGFADTAYLDDPVIIAAHEAVRDASAKYGPPAEDSDYVFRSHKYGMAYWNELLFSNAMLATIPLPFHWGAAPLPYGAPGRRAGAWSDAWVMANDSTHPEETWEFLKYLASPEVMAARSAALHEAPVRKSLMEDYVAAQYPGMDPQAALQVKEGAIKYGVESIWKRLWIWDDYSGWMNIIFAYPRPNNSDKPAAEVLPELNQQLIEQLKKIQEGTP